MGKFLFCGWKVIYIINVMNIGVVFNQFCNLLQNRTGIMTEDNIRYYWFVSMLNQDPILNNYTLEQPYSDNPIQVKILPNEELDLLYGSSAEIFCFEIKLHKEPKQTTLAETSAAGDIFNDIQRLQQIPQSVKGVATRHFFLYVTDDIMHNYFISKGQQNPFFGQQLNDFYNARINNPINLNFASAPKSFLNSANNSFKNNPNPITLFNLRLLHYRDFSLGCSSFNGKCHVRLYEI